ncbi:hypothetical protein MVEN_00601400 [Mycena venus]|uniref:Transmembrane protein n=1 Tax=Mycena venus TaxID=2733690 RepID=A0A8H6YP01_9AGAR|nr:hypothetical protein MVEN_00601400 [Mycena venus]
MSPHPVLPPGSDSNASSLLPPDLVRQLQVSRLVVAGTSAVLIWDILHNLEGDYYLLFKYKFRLSTAAYFVSRIASLIVVLGFTLFTTSPLNNCRAAMITFNSFYPLSTGSTSLLFFLRVRAIYNDQRLIPFVFGCLWLCVVGVGIVVSFSGHAETIASSCTAQSPSYLWVAGAVLAAHDTSVFVAISCRLLATSPNDYTFGEKVQAFFRGANLHAFSKAVFQDGQKYFIIAVIANIVTISMVLDGGTGPAYRGMAAMPNIALTSIMGGRVYRNVRLHSTHIPHMSFSVTDEGSGGARMNEPSSAVNGEVITQQNVVQPAASNRFVEPRASSWVRDPLQLHTNH